MAGNIQIVIHPNGIDPVRWDNFVSHHPGGNFFQSPRFFQFLRELPGFRVSVLAAWDGDEMVGLCQAFRQKNGMGLKGYLSRRTIVYGGPLTRGNDGHIIAQMLIQALGRYHDSLYTEIRNLADLSPYKDLFRRSGYQYRPHLNYIVNLSTDHSSALSLLNSGKRRQVRKSLDSGAEIIAAKETWQVRQFYRILRDLYRRRIRKPLPGWDFFEKFYLHPELGRYLLILYKNRIIGGIMCPVYNKTVYEWYVCGEDGQHAHVYPSVLATYAALQYGIEHHCETFDFLGAGQPGQDYGVRQFKSQFGGREVEFGRYLRINRPLLYSAGKLGYQVSRSLFF
jgi:lipid II:glycine glycyltransferase (peptidoglycan interpeptide bridge formation enzyme)